MPLEQAKLKELSQEHQPSLIATRRRVPSIVDGRILIFEEKTAWQALAKGTLKEACTSLAFVCGAMLYDIGYPFKDVFITQPTLACADHAEPFSYNLGVCARCGLSDKLCCFSAEG